MLTPENSPKYLLVGYINYVETAMSFVDNEVPMSYGEWLVAYEHCHESQVEQPNVKKDVNEKLIEYLSDIFYHDFASSATRAVELAKIVEEHWIDKKSHPFTPQVISDYDEAQSVFLSLDKCMEDKYFVKTFC